MKYLAVALPTFIPPKPLVKTLPLLVAVMVLSLAVVRGVTPSALNQDIAWKLYSGEVLLDGGQYGVDVVDPNPPLVFWISMIVVWFARLLHIKPQLAYDIVVASLVLGSATLCYAALKGWALPGRQRVLIAGLLAVVMAIAAGRDFGQRDHVMAVMVVPYLFVLGNRLDDRPTSFTLGLAAGALAGVGIALKPFFLLMWVIPQTYVALFHRGRPVWNRAENLAILAIHFLYAGFIVASAPEFFTMLPLVFAYHNSYATPIPFLNQGRIL